MVAKISHGASLYGALVYNHEKVFQGTAEILSGHRMISDRPGLPSEDMRLALLSFENHLTANRRTDKPVLHIALSPAPEDRLDNDRLAELAEKYMQKMGYGDQPFIVYRHGDTCNTHVHIVSVCIDDEGRKINDSEGNDIMLQQIQRNYDQIKADAQVIINEEMERIKNDPELCERLGIEIAEEENRKAE